MSINNFCTLFDSNYLTRGLAMYNSLNKYCKNFHLYIFPFDELSKNILIQLKLDNCTIISLAEFENPDLLRVKKERTRSEYCWTASSSTILYCIKRYQLENCTYIDADLFFYNSPEQIFSEIAESSILITSHRYTPKYDRSERFGKYCVQFVYFRNDKYGMKALQWWVDACIEWCYNRVENGKFGDQKYLDDWTEKFQKTHELENLGGGVAPWNIQQYNFSIESNKIVGVETKTNKKFDLIFYHFHYLRFLKNNRFDIGSYKITSQQIELIYKPYLNALKEAENQISKFHKLENPHGIAKEIILIKKIIRYIKLGFKYNINILKTKLFWHQ